MKIVLPVVMLLIKLVRPFVIGLVALMLLSAACSSKAPTLRLGGSCSRLELPRDKCEQWLDRPPSSTGALARPVLIFPGWLDYPERYEDGPVVKCLQKRHPGVQIMVLDYNSRASVQRSAQNAIKQVPSEWLGGQVDVYAHSLGGVIALEAYRQGLPIRKLITTESPLRGTGMARLAGLVGLGSPATRDMCPYSQAIKTLQSLESYPEIVTIGKGFCLLMPRSSYESLGCRHYHFSASPLTFHSNHNMLGWDPRAARIIVEELESGPDER